MHPTPLRVDKIVGILKAGVRSNAFPIYPGGAGDGQSVGRLGSVVGRPFLVTCADLGCERQFDRSWCSTPVMQAWFDRSWCCLPVMQAWFDRSWCCLPVVPGVIAC
jgi:hypothetical protein